MQDKTPPRRPRSWRHTGHVTLLAMTALAPVVAVAQVRSAATLSGDWGGARARYLDAGVTFRGDYVSETFASVSGGLRRGSAYAQQLRVGADFDMQRIAGWSGTLLRVTLNDRRGTGISSDYIGNRLPVQEVYGGLYTRLSEASVEHNLLDGRLNLRLGYFAMGNDLGGMALGTQFVNAAFCAHPLSQSGNSGWYNYPNARWGAAMRYRLTPELLVRTGVFQNNPRLGEEHKAFKPFASGTIGTVLPLELEYAPGSAPHSTALPGHYKLGVFFDTARAQRQGDTGMVGQRYGAYLLADQMLVRDGPTGRSLSVFGQFTAHPRASAPITRWYAAGLVKTGTFAGRDADTLALGVVQATLNPRLRERAGAAFTAEADAGGGAHAALPQGETVIELSYGLQPRGWLGVRGSIQYIVDPGAFNYRTTPHALALGTQLRIAF